MTIILSKRNNSTTAPFAARLVGSDRTKAVQALEAAVQADHIGGVANGRGNVALRSFIETNDNHLVWGNYRLDVVELPKESK